MQLKKRMAVGDVKVINRKQFLKAYNRFLYRLALWLFISFRLRVFKLTFFLNNTTCYRETVLYSVL